MLYPIISFIFLTSISLASPKDIDTCAALTPPTSPTVEALALQKVQELYELDLDFVLRVPNRGPYALYLLEGLGWHYYPFHKTSPWVHNPGISFTRMQKAHKIISALKVLNDLYFSIEPAFLFSRPTAPLPEPFDIGWEVYMDHIHFNGLTLFDETNKQKLSLFVFLENYLGYEYHETRWERIKGKPAKINVHPEVHFVIDFLKELELAKKDNNLDTIKAKIKSIDKALGRAFYFLREADDLWGLTLLFRLLEIAKPSDFNLNPQNLRVALPYYVMTASIEDNSPLQSKNGHILPEVFLAIQIGQLVRHPDDPNNPLSEQVREQALEFFKEWVVFERGSPLP